MQSSLSAPKLVAVEIEATSAAVPSSNNAVLVNDGFLKVPLTGLRNEPGSTPLLKARGTNSNSSDLASG